MQETPWLKNFRARVALVEAELEGATDMAEAKRIMKKYGFRAPFRDTRERIRRAREKE